MNSIFKPKMFSPKPIKLNWFDMHPFCSGALAMFVLIGLLYLAVGG